MESLMVNTEYCRQIQACYDYGCSGLSGQVKAYTSNRSVTPVISNKTSNSFTVIPSSPVPVAPSPSLAPLDIGCKYYYLNDATAWRADTNAVTFTSLACTQAVQVCTNSRNGDASGQNCANVTTSLCASILPSTNISIRSTSYRSVTLDWTESTEHEK